MLLTEFSMLKAVWDCQRLFSFVDLMRSLQKMAVFFNSFLILYDECGMDISALFITDDSSVSFLYIKLKIWKQAKQWTIFQIVQSEKLSRWLSSKRHIKPWWEAWIWFVKTLSFIKNGSIGFWNKRLQKSSTLHKQIDWTSRIQSYLFFFIMRHISCFKVGLFDCFQSNW